MTIQNGKSQHRSRGTFVNAQISYVKAENNFVSNSTNAILKLEDEVGRRLTVGTNSVER